MQPALSFITLVPLLRLESYFLVLYLFFPALLAVVKHLSEDMQSQPRFTVSPGSLGEN